MRTSYYCSSDVESCVKLNALYVDSNITICFLRIPATKGMNYKIVNSMNIFTTYFGIFNLSNFWSHANSAQLSPLIADRVFSSVTFNIDCVTDTKRPIDIDYYQTPLYIIIIFLVWSFLCVLVVILSLHIFSCVFSTFFLIFSQNGNYL